MFFFGRQTESNESRQGQADGAPTRGIIQQLLSRALDAEVLPDREHYLPEFAKIVASDRELIKREIAGVSYATILDIVSRDTIVINERSFALAVTEAIVLRVSDMREKFLDIKSAETWRDTLRSMMGYYTPSESYLLENAALSNAVREMLDAGILFESKDVSVVSCASPGMGMPYRLWTIDVSQKGLGLLNSLS